MCVYKTPVVFLKEAISSILNQTFTNFEFIIVDDGTPDDGGFVCDEYAKHDKRIKVIHKTNGGLSSARNAGIEAASGKYIALMDSDDIALPTRLEKQVRYLEQHSDVVVLGTWYKHFGDKTNEVKVTIEDHELYRTCLFFHNVPTLLNPSAMIRKSVLDENKIRYAEELRFAEDYLFWVQISVFGRIVNFPEILMYYRVHPNQATNANVRKRNDKNTYIINEYQLKQIGITFSKDDIQLYFCNYVHTYNDLIKVSDILAKVIEKNNETLYFDSIKFQSSCNNYLYSSMSRLRNPFKIIRLMMNKKTSRIMKKALSDKIKRRLIRR